jgi:hypothetical protein
MSISGYTTTTTAVVEVGLGDELLTFDKAVRLLIPGMAGKNAAYIRNGDSHVISNCSTTYGDSQTTGDSLGAGAECKMDVGSDMVIWTKHFTQFIAYSQTAVSNTGSSSSWYTTTPTPTVAPTATAVPSNVPTETPTVSGTPVTPGEDEPGIGGATATPQPGVTATIQPTTPATGAAAGNDLLWIIAGVVVLGAAAAYIFMNKK